MAIGDSFIAPEGQNPSRLFGELAAQLLALDSQSLTSISTEWWTLPLSELSGELVRSGRLTRESADSLVLLVEEALSRGTRSSTPPPALAGGDDATRVDPGAKSTAIAGEVAGVAETPGRYEDESEYARGGMGRILRVHDRMLHREVALKELIPEAGTADETLQQDRSAQLANTRVRRFLREAAITGQLDHPSIVPVYEVGRRVSGTLYYTMKLVRGRTLTKAIRSAESLGERLALLPSYLDLCQAIAYAHSRGIVHRDIKPANVMIGAFGETNVLDWGLAKVKGGADLDGLDQAARSDDSTAEAEDSLRTAVGAKIGTPRYMAPEQALGDVESVDEQSDVYSLGVVLYELLTSHSPYESHKAQAVMEEIVERGPIPLEKWGVAIPPDLAGICEKAMAKAKGERYANAGELAADIERFQSGALVEAYEYNAWDRVKRFAFRHKGILTTAALAAVVIISGAVVAYGNILEARNQEREQRMQAEESLETAQNERYRANLRLAAQQLEQGQTTSALNVLTEMPNGHRNWEWQNLRALAEPSMLVYSGHSDRVLDFDFVPGTYEVVSASYDGTAQHWNWKTGEVLGVYRLPDDHYARHVSVREDGAFVACGSEFGSIIIADLRSRAVTVTARIGTQAIRSLVWLPNGEQLLVGTTGNTIPILRASDGKVIDRIPTDKKILGNLTCTSDAGVIYAQTVDPAQPDLNLASRTGYLAIDRATRTSTARFPGSVLQVDTSDQTMAWAEGHTLCIAPLGVPSQAVRLAGHEDPIVRIVFLDGGNRVVSGDRSGRLIFRQGPEWNEVGRYSGEALLHDILYSPGASKLFVLLQRGVHVLREDGLYLDTLRGFQNGVQFGAVTAQEGALVGVEGSERNVRVWSTNVPTTLPEATDDLVHPYGYRVSETGASAFITYHYGPIIGIDLEHGTPRFEFYSASFPRFSASDLRADGTVAVFEHGPEFIVWDFDQRSVIARIASPSHTVYSLRLVPGKPRFVTYDKQGAFYLLDWELGEQWLLDTPEVDSTQTQESFRSYAITADGQTLAYASVHDGVRAIDLDSRRETGSVPKVSTNSVGCFSMSPNGQLAAVGTYNGLVHVVDLARMISVTELEGSRKRVDAVTFSLDGKRLLAADESDQVNVWDTSDWRLLHTMGNAIGGGRFLSWTLDGALHFHSSQSGFGSYDLAPRQRIQPPGTKANDSERELLLGTERYDTLCSYLERLLLRARMVGARPVVGDDALLDDDRLRAPAWGLHPGDVILTLNGESASTVHPEALTNLRTLTIARLGSRIIYRITVFT